jgi:acyl-CoA synthetase (AMP-forming)/AMP-acid ligase II
VEVDGEGTRILGRKSDLIIVGGKKVFPGEVEKAIVELPQRRDAKVWGEEQALTGQLVCAAVVANVPIADEEALRITRRHCNSNLARYEVPVKVNGLPESRVGFGPQNESSTEGGFVIRNLIASYFSAFALSKVRAGPRWSDQQPQCRGIEERRE